MSKRGQTLAQGIERDKYLNNTKNTQDIEKTETIAVEDMSKEQLVQLFYKLADEGRFDDEDIDDCDGCHAVSDVKGFLEISIAVGNDRESVISLRDLLVSGKLRELKIGVNRPVVNVDRECIISGCSIQKPDASACPLIVITEQAWHWRRNERRINGAVREGTVRRIGAVRVDGRHN